MKIVFIITRSDEIGGAQVHVRDIASQMVLDGNDVTVLVGGDDPLTKQLEDNKVKVIKINNLVREISPINDWKAYRQIKKVLKEIEPDLVTTHSSKAGLLGRLASKACGYPVIFTAHGWAFTDGVSPVKKFIYRYLEKIGAHYSDKIINVSEQDRQLALKNRIDKAELHITIHNGIGKIQDLEKDRIIKEQIIVDYDKPKPVNLIMVARFSAPKDHETLFRALAQLKEYNWYLRLVGTGPKIEEMKALAKRLEIESLVEFMGERFDVPELLEASDIFVLTTNWEGLPISIIEAMRAGLPVIASDVGGVKELLSDDLEWGLVDKKGYEQLKDKLKELFESENKINALGDFSGIKYKSTFSFDEMYKNNFEVYNQILDK